MTGTIGEVRLFAGNFAPRGWAFCSSQLLSVTSNQALYSIIGTTWGGDGRTTFALPKTRGRAPIGIGSMPEGGIYRCGQLGGYETASLTVLNLPAHNHSAQGEVISADASFECINGPAGTDDPSNALPALAENNNNIYSSEDGDVTMGSVDVPVAGYYTVGSTGGGQPHSNMQPFIVMNYIICLMGNYPQRN